MAASDEATQAKSDMEAAALKASEEAAARAKATEEAEAAVEAAEEAAAAVSAPFAAHTYDAVRAHLLTEGWSEVVGGVDYGWDGDGEGVGARRWAGAVWVMWMRVVLHSAGKSSACTEL